MKYSIILFIVVLTGQIYAQELLVPKLKAYYWISGVLDSMIYQPCDEGEDAFTCWNLITGVCDSNNYGDFCHLALKEDWQWTRRVFIRFDSLVTSYDSLENAQLWMYKYGTATNTNWIQGYLVTGSWDEHLITHDTEPTVDMGISSDQFTPPFPDWEGWVYLNIDTIYDHWVAGPNYGIHIRQQDLDSDDGQDFYSSENCTPVDPAFVFPPESIYTSCEYQQIISVFDYYCVQVDSSRLTFTVNGTNYPITSSELAINRYPFSDTLIFTPSTPFSDGDTVETILNEIYTDMGIWSPESPLSHLFYVDLSGPDVVSSTIPVDGSLSPGTDSVCLWLFDRMSGIDPASIDIELNGSIIPHSTTWLGDTLLLCSDLTSLNDSNEICIHSEDLAQLCGKNVTDTCWSFYQILGTIDSVWFYEETDCDGFNWITICYRLTGDTVNTVRRISSDMGATWDVPASTVTDTIDQLGLSIIPGDHCFNWLLSDDLPGIEEDDWMVGIGIDTTTGGAYASVDSIWVNSAPGPVDSRGPDVDIGGIEPRYSIGGLVDLEWLTADLHPGTHDAIIQVLYDGIADTFTSSDTFLTISAPATCDSVLTIVSVRDSFCNWGSDSVEFIVCPEFEAILDCAPCGTFSSCSTQTVSYIIADTLCSTSPTSVFLSVEVFHFAGGSDYYSYAGPSADVTLTEIPGTGWNVLLENIPYSDGDSLFIVFDSLFNENECKTEP